MQLYIRFLLPRVVLPVAALAAAFCVLLTSGSLVAQESPLSAGTFQAVDSVEIRKKGIEVEVRGVLEGQATQSAVKVNVGSYSNEASVRTLERCERLALLAMAKPGAYLFRIAQVDYYAEPVQCRLSRRQ